ncbi:unnamed protein product [Closterium sp. NIES-65]|nr:unnamed protein product [Closterium sp. NIES-65]
MTCLPITPCPALCFPFPPLLLSFHPVRPSSVSGTLRPFSRADDFRRPSCCCFVKPSYPLAAPQPHPLFTQCGPAASSALSALAAALTASEGAPAAAAAAVAGLKDAAAKLPPGGRERAVLGRRLRAAGRRVTGMGAYAQGKAAQLGKAMAAAGEAVAAGCTDDGASNFDPVKTFKLGPLTVDVTPSKALTGAAVAVAFSVVSWQLVSGLQAVDESSLAYANDKALTLALVSAAHLFGRFKAVHPVTGGELAAGVRATGSLQKLSGICPLWHLPSLAYALSGICLLWNLPSLAFALSGICPLWHLPSLAFALSGTCPLWHMPSLACALSGICPLWHMPSLAFALSGICPLWHMPSLAFALSGTCPLWHWQYEGVVRPNTTPLYSRICQCTLSAWCPPCHGLRLMPSPSTLSRNLMSPAFLSLLPTYHASPHQSLRGALLAMGYGSCLLSAFAAAGLLALARDLSSQGGEEGN